MLARKIPAVLGIDLVLCVIAGLGIYQAHCANSLPIKLTQNASSFLLLESINGVPQGATLVSVDGSPIDDEDALQFYLDGKPTGRSVTTVFATQSHQTISRTLPLVPRYNWWYTGVQVFVTLTFFGFGLFLWFKRYQDPAARVAHWLAYSAGSIVALSPGSHVALMPFLDSLVRIGYTLGSVFTGVLYVHFALLFPRRQSLPKLLAIIYPLAIVSAMWEGSTAVRAFSTGSLVLFQRHLYALHAAQIGFCILGVLASYLFARSYRHTIETSERRKIKWALAGSAFSVLAYIILWVLPQLLEISPIVPEELILITSILAPISIAIAIARHRLFDIDAVLSRAATYGLAVGLLILAYTGLAAILASIIGTRLPLPLAAVVAVTVALIFEPTKRRLQQWIDRRFFRVRYDFRLALVRLQDDLLSADDRGTILSTLYKAIQQLLQPTTLNVRNGGERKGKLCGHPHYVEPGLQVSPLDSRMLAVTVPISIADAPLTLELGPKRSGARYSKEDIDLLSSITVQVAMKLERITLREKLAQEELEAERARELNRVRSLIVSSISHDLKSPLTSIHMFAELLESSVSHERDREYLRIIEGESERLTSLIDNVLDYSRIERGVMQYSIEPVSLSDIVRSALRPLSYLLELQNVSLDVAYGPIDPVIAGDKSALLRTITNLLSNAMKYSGDHKDIHVAVSATDYVASLIVRDHGIGIPEKDLASIFQPYYRSTSSAKHAPGAGLGLATVQHVVEAHSGSIAVSSTVGLGTTFTLSFPLLHAQNTDH